MQSDEYTSFTGPLKHAKGKQAIKKAIKKAEQSGEEIEYFKKS